MKVKIDEIAESIFRIAVQPNGSFISFNHYLIRDEVGTLIHAGHRATFATVKEQVQKLIPLKNLQLILFSHFESDECGSLNGWLTAATFSTIRVDVHMFESRCPQSSH